MARYILHVDGDNFFASCLVAKYPKLRGLPLVVGAERGMATALSIEAKKLGLKRGDPIFKIKESHKDVIIMSGDYEYFGNVSRKMHSIIEGFTSNIEKYSIDESFADITDVVLKRNSTPEIVGKEIKNKIQLYLGINVSVGISHTKTLAKLTSTSSKPNGFKVALNNNEIDSILEKTEVEKIWGIGKQSSIFLRTRGIYTALELKNVELSNLSGLGKPIREIKDELSGIIIKDINKTHPLEHSMISSQSFKATDEMRYIKSEFVRHILSLTERLRKNSAAANKMTVYIRDSKLNTRAINCTLINHTECNGIYLEHLDNLLPHIYDGSYKIKTAGVCFENIVPISQTNTSLFDNLSEKENIVFKTIDMINKKGVKIFSASLLK